VITAGHLKLKITMSTEAWHRTLSLTNSFQFALSHPISLRSILMFSFHLCLRSYKRCTPLRPSDWNVLCISNFSHACLCATHLMLCNLIGIRILCEEYCILFFSYIFVIITSFPSIRLSWSIGSVAGITGIWSKIYLNCYFIFLFWFAPTRPTSLIIFLYYTIV
jgi:hypothetical protein